MFLLCILTRPINTYSVTVNYNRSRCKYGINLFAFPTMIKKISESIANKLWVRIYLCVTDVYHNQLKSHCCRYPYFKQLFNIFNWIMTYQPDPHQYTASNVYKMTLSYSTRIVNGKLNYFINKKILTIHLSIFIFSIIALFNYNLGHLKQENT